MLDRLLGVPGIEVSGFTQWASPVTYDWTGAANTSFGSAGVIGNTSQGINGWTPKTSNVWKINANVASATSGAGISYLTDELYLSTAQCLNCRVAVQGNGLGSPAYYTLGAAFNPTTGEGYVLVWIQASAIFSLRRMYGSGTYPATTAYGLTLANLTYTGGQSSDWAVMERTVLGKTSVIRISLCPDAGGHPDYRNPRLAATYYDSYAPLAVTAYPFVSSCQVGYTPTSPRFEVSLATREFVTDAFLFGFGKSVAIALTGRGTNWTPGSVFTASSGLTINSVTYTDATHVTLNCSTGSAVKQVTITEPGGATQQVRVGKYAVTESREIYYIERNSKGTKGPGIGGVGISTFVTLAAIYGVGFSLDGNYVYILQGTSDFKKYNLAGTLQSTITVPSGANVRKMMTLPDGKYIVCDYGSSPPKYHLYNSDDSYNRVWNGTATTSTYGLCLFYDNALARNTVLTAGWTNAIIQQWETDGTLIKTWASGNGMVQVSDVCVLSDGTVVVAEWFNGKLLKFDNTGAFVATLTTTADHPHDLTVLSDDTIVAAFESSTPGARVYAYAPDGSDMGAWATGQASLPVGVKVYPLPAPTPA